MLFSELPKKTAEKLPNFLQFINFLAFWRNISHRLKKRNHFIKSKSLAGMMSTRVMRGHQSLFT